MSRDNLILILPTLDDFYGGRRCLGESFAELECLLIVATLASKVRLRLVDGQIFLPDPLMTLKPTVSVQMTVESVDTPERRPATV